ncbi:MAG: M48 family metallopeptidase [Phycisphaerae bacterium]|nr:M48 family metallopeptidase [Phycisphaerae bacterium]
MRAKTTLLIFLGTFVITMLAGCAVNPISGDKEFMLLSESEDLQIGQQYAPEVVKEMGGEIPDAALQSYIDSVGQKIAAVSHRKDWTYHYSAVNDKTVNAFALPGGYIFITRGMLEKLNSEAQLAAILAHETVHVVARHTASQMSRDIGIQLLVNAATTEKTPQTAILVADLTRQIVGLRYSRSDESESDMGGLDYLVKAGYNPYAMEEVMQILMQAGGGGGPEFLSSHPSPENRLDSIHSQIKRDYPTLDVSKLKVGEDEYRSGVLNKL